LILLSSKVKESVYRCRLSGVASARAILVGGDICETKVTGAVLRKNEMKEGICAS
jgi:hypothetical protein